MVGNNHQGNKRDLLTLAVLNGKDTVYSEIAPAKHWHIAQKDVRIVIRMLSIMHWMQSKGKLVCR